MAVTLAGAIVLTAVLLLVSSARGTDAPSSEPAVVGVRAPESLNGGLWTTSGVIAA